MLNRNIQASLAFAILLGALCMGRYGDSQWRLATIVELSAVRGGYPDCSSSCYSSTVTDCGDFTGVYSCEVQYTCGAGGVCVTSAPHTAYYTNGTYTDVTCQSTGATGVVAMPDKMCGVEHLCAADCELVGGVLKCVKGAATGGFTGLTPQNQQSAMSCSSGS